MKVLIDLQACQGINKDSRVGHYCESFAHALVRNAGGNEIGLLLNSLFSDSVEAIREAFSDSLPSERITVFGALGPVAQKDPKNAMRARTAELMREYAISELQPDIVLIGNLFEGYQDDGVTSIGRLGSGIPTVVVHYDLNPFCEPARYLRSSTELKWYSSKIDSLKRADVLLAISDSARREAMSCLHVPSENIVNISSGVDDRFHIKAPSAWEREGIMSRYGIWRPFVLHIGRSEYPEDTERLVYAYSLLPASVREMHQLLLVHQGDEGSRRRLYELAAQRGLAKDELRIAGGVLPDAELVELYGMSKLFVVPSLHEDSGLAALDAMAWGTAVIGSNTSGLPEILGRDDALFDPREASSMVSLLHRVLKDDMFAKSLREHAGVQSRKFTWDATAKKALETCEQLSKTLSAQAQTAPVNLRQRLAIVGPSSWIAAQYSELMCALARDCDLTVVTEAARMNLGRTAKNIAFRSIDWFAKEVGAFDRILYVVGDAPIEERILSLMHEKPGVVLLHDFSIGSTLDRMERKTISRNAFLRALYNSHGYDALIYDKTHGRRASIDRYPCNRSLLERAIGVIVYSKNDIAFAEECYGRNFPRSWHLIQQPASMAAPLGRLRSRKSLGIRPQDFLICSLDGQLESNRRLLNAWEESALVTDASCRLVFVDDGSDKDRTSELRKLIKASSSSERISIAAHSIREFLEAADAGIQLYCPSRGTQSRKALDLLGLGTPLVLGTEGALAGYPNDVSIKLPSGFSDSELAAALERFRRDPDLRQLFGNTGREWVEKYHNAKIVALHFLRAIESSYNARRLVAYQTTLEEIGRAPDIDFAAFRTLAENKRVHRKSQILIDVSAIAQSDHKTGIQRVTRAIVREFIRNQPSDWRIEPVRADATEKTYRYARDFALKLIDLSPETLEDDIVEVEANDVFLGLDLNMDNIPLLRPWFENQRRRGMKIAFVLYDLLPVFHPEWFVHPLSDVFIQWLATVISVSHLLVGISRTVANETIGILNDAKAFDIKKLKVSSFQLGADLENSESTTGLPEGAPEVLKQLKSRKTFLMVGTVEPRKGHAQVLAGFEQLWAEGHSLNLVIVGKKGWKVEKLTERLDNHVQKGKQLYWLQGVSDEFLKRIYEVSTVLIAASEGEGFGLPLIEAVHNGIPLIARDIPVFREVARDCAFYFSGLAPVDVTNVVRKWLNLQEEGRTPDCTQMPWITWKESTEQLKRIVLDYS